jgi:protein TonB
MAVTRAQLIAIAIAGSIALHVGIAASVASIHKAPVHRGPTSITVHNAKKKEAKKQEKPPEPIVAKNEPVVAKRATPPKPAPKAAEPKAQPAAAAAAPVAEFAMTLSNGGGSGPGIAVPTHAATAAAPTTSATTPQVKTLVAKASADECRDPPSKPKPIKVVQPAYTEKAREAQVEGRVRVELVVDENGKVASAKVLAGLGHGLDEAALAAARSSTFAAATKCGKAVSSTFVIGMRFNL